MILKLQGRLRVVALVWLMGVFLSAVCAQAADGNSSNASTKPDTTHSDFEILTDTQGIDFGPYLRTAFARLKKIWYANIPQSARLPEMKQGEVVLQISILKDGRKSDLKIVQSSADDKLDEASLKSLAETNFDPLPANFRGDSLKMRLHFKYNPYKTKPGSDENRTIH